MGSTGDGSRGRKGCHGRSVAALAMSVEDWVCRNRETGEVLQAALICVFKNITIPLSFGFSWEPQTTAMVRLLQTGLSLAIC